MVVAPRHTSVSGLTTSSSAPSHGRQAAISTGAGFAWMRRVPFATHLKCFPTLVT